MTHPERRPGGHFEDRSSNFGSHDSYPGDSSRPGSSQLRSSNRGPFGGGPGRTPIINAPAIVTWTIAFIAATTIIVWNAPDPLGYRLEIAGAVSPLRFLSGPQASGGILGMIAPLFSHMGLHGDIMHLFFNSFWLLALGAPVARSFGADTHHSGSGKGGLVPSSVFLSYFALSGAAGALFYIAVNPNEYVLLVGASGGVSGLLGGIVRFALQPPALFAQGAPRFVSLSDSRVLAASAVIIGSNIVVAFYGAGGLTGGDAQIAWEAHIGGYLFGLIAYPFFRMLSD